MYWLDINNDNKLIAYDLTTQQQKNDITMAHSVGTYACLTANDAFLFVLGGIGNGGYVDTVQIYNILESRWMSSIQNMNSPRGGGCLATPNQLHVWSFGGRSAGDIKVKTVEVYDINQNTWQNSNDLQLVTEGAVSVFYNNMIVIMGGREGREAHLMRDDIQTIDCPTGITAVYSVKLNYAMPYMAGVKVGDIAYLFGGIFVWDTTKNMQYLDLLSIIYLSFKTTKKTSTNKLK